ncbi:MAG: hemolysin III family protein [Lachnospiraceae bacterium]|nr:hemolysin III family protein [Lachnospiraceae bacterium]
MELSEQKELDVITNVSVVKEKKESKIPIPKYTLGEEIVNAISHGIGAIFGIVALVVCIVGAARGGGAIEVLSAVIFGVSLVIMYTMSTIYHSLKPCKGKRVLRVFDHCCIFLLIAGSYTPFTLVSLRGKTGWALFALVWGISILGIVLNAVNVEKFKVFSMIAYIALGWLIIFKFKDLYNAVPFGCIKLLLAGGITYTVGAIIYGIGSKVKYMHSIWHFFVVGGSVLHFLSILIYVY